MFTSETTSLVQAACIDAFERGRKETHRPITHSNNPNIVRVISKESNENVSEHNSRSHPELGSVWNDVHAHANSTANYGEGPRKMNPHQITPVSSLYGGSEYSHGGGDVHPTSKGHMVPIDVSHRLLLSVDGSEIPEDEEEKLASLPSLQGGSIVMTDLDAKSLATSNLPALPPSHQSKASERISRVSSTSSLHRPPSPHGLLPPNPSSTSAGNSSFQQQPSTQYTNRPSVTANAKEIIQ